MITGFKGAFVISWSQTEVDGFRAGSIDSVKIGATWRWSGKAVRVDGPPELLLLGGSEETANLRRRAAHSVRRLVGAAMAPKRSLDEVDIDQPRNERGFTLTDGRMTFVATLIDVAPEKPPLLMFLNDYPPVESDLWVVSTTLNEGRLTRHTDMPEGVICFGSGTLIETDHGAKRIEDINVGDLVQTKDDGFQPIHWTGQRRMTGARLYAMPELRPIRIAAGALGVGEPTEDLLLSPDHRILLKGNKARALFNTEEVLVAAKDLVNGRTIVSDHRVREITYHHLLLENHQILFANGIESESYHPANTSLDAVAEDQRHALLDAVPVVQDDPTAYGEYVRRNLSASEAAILMHNVA